MKKLSIIIPAYNEERSISQILGKIHQTRLIGETEKEILHYRRRFKRQYS